MKLFDRLNAKVNQLLTGTVIPSTEDNTNTPAGPAEARATDMQPPNLSRPFCGPWRLEDTLINFQTINKKGRQDQIPFSLANAYEGSFIFGGVGSGKTSGSGRTFAASFMRKGFGGLVLCVKADEAANWMRYAQENGRTDDLVLFNEENQSCFNFLDYELRNARGNPAEAATGVLMELVGASGGGDSKNKMWERASRRLIRSCLLALQLANESPTLARMYAIATTPITTKEVMDKAAARGDAGELTPSQMADYTGVYDYFTGEWRAMAGETRASVLLNMTATCDPFMSGSLRDMFTQETNVSPEDIFEGKIIVVDLPTLKYYEAGRVAQIAWKYCLQRAVQRRIVSDDDRPTFIFADESQAVITDGDGVFVETSRSHRCATVFLTQNRPNLLARMSKERVDSMLGNFQTKVWHQNGDPETNEWAANVIAKDYQMRANSSVNYSSGGHQGGGGGGGSTSYQQTLEHQLLPVEFLRLAKGGNGEFKKIVTAYLFQSGRNFGTSGESFAMIGFRQGEPVPR